tara:strand:- start:113426 stop:114415 length:990 start_codon:yes stop_codon:yes gene_type:complete
MSLIIAGDIGGTKTSLALYEFSDHTMNHTINCIKQDTFASHDFNQFNDILLKFIEQQDHSEIDILSISVAGPVIDNECQTTNLPWHISADDIKRELNISHVILFNDIEASGFGLLQAVESDLIQINPKAKTQTGNQGIISIGTGLGEAFMFWDGTKHIPCGTEGGHTDFAPLINADLALWQHFKAKYPEHLSYERLLSGPGISQIYDYLCLQHQLENISPSQDTSAWISLQAIQNTNHLCSETMDIFIRFLANEAANLCLKTFAIGGIFITGGIAPKILPLLRQPNFMRHFVKKGRFKDMLQAVPIWINKNEQAPLNGALSQALKYTQS